MKFRMLMVVGGLLTIALAASGCSSASTPDSSGTADGYAATKAAAADRVAGMTDVVDVGELGLDPLPTGAADLEGEKVLIIPLATAIFSTMIDTITEAVELTGAEVQVCDGKANPTEILSCMDQAKSLQAAAVITIAVSPDVAGNGYASLEAAGIPTLGAWQDPLSAQETDKLRFYSSIPTISRALDASSDYILSTSDEAPTILMVGNTDSGAIEQVNQEWYEYTVQNCPECDVTYKTSTTAQKDQVKDLVSGQLITTPETDAALAFNLDTFGAPMVEGVANASTQVRMGGQGVATTALQLLKEGRVDHVVGTSYFFVGYAMTDSLLRLMNGLEPVEYMVPIRIFTSDNIGDIDLAPENVATFEWYGDPSFVDEFTTAWGVE